MKFEDYQRLINNPRIVETIADMKASGFDRVATSLNSSGLYISVSGQIGQRVECVQVFFRSLLAGDPVKEIVSALDKILDKMTAT